MSEGHKIQILPLVSPGGWWGLFINDVLVRAFDTQGQAVGWASDPTLV